ncbi:MAG: DoxX family protein [Sciscionella sp.]|nr:DoxX family protein [Sciscionella sp.]
MTGRQNPYRADSTDHETYRMSNVSAGQSAGDRPSWAERGAFDPFADPSEETVVGAPLVEPPEVAAQRRAATASAAVSAAGGSSASAFDSTSDSTGAGDSTGASDSTGATRASGPNAGGDEPESLLPGVGTLAVDDDDDRKRLEWSASTDLGLLVLRLVVGGTVGAHGLQHLFGLLNGMGIDKFTTFVDGLGFKYPQVLAYVTGWTEVVGGGFLLLGMLTPLAAAGVLGVLANVVVLKWNTGFFLGPNGGYEFELALAAGAFALMFAGPGRVAMDNGRAWHRRPAIGATIGLVLAVAGVIVAQVVFRTH